MKVTLPLIFFGILHITAASIGACTCNVRPPACFEYWRTEAVFVGTIQKVNPITEGSRFASETVEVSVSEAFRGVNTPSVTTSNYETSCSFRFKAGESFLFYGALNKTNEFGTSFCTRTALLEKDPVDLEFLRAVKSDKPVYWAWGTISDSGYYSPVSGIRAEVLGQRRKIEGISNDDGDIKLEVPAAGTYRIRIYLPKGRTYINGVLRNETELWEMQHKQIVGGRFKGSNPYVDYKVQVGPNRCGWFDVSIPSERYTY